MEGSFAEAIGGMHGLGPCLAEAGKLGRAQDLEGFGSGEGHGVNRNGSKSDCESGSYPPLRSGFGKPCQPGMSP